VLTIYEQAVESGAQLVVGPLTRNGSRARGEQPRYRTTLALNSLEPRAPQPARLYLFGLSVELEARQVARWHSTTLPQRVHTQRRHDARNRNARGISPGVRALRRDHRRRAQLQCRPVQPEQAAPGANLGVADMVFLALDSRARAPCERIRHTLALYATSQVNAAEAARWPRVISTWCVSSTCRGCCSPTIRGDDLPAPAVGRSGSNSTACTRSGSMRFASASSCCDRARAGGGRRHGRIRLTGEQQFVRELTAAQYVDGKTVILSVPR